MTSGIASMFISSERQPAVMNMFVMPIESIHGVIVNGPAMLTPFWKNATMTNVWATSFKTHYSQYPYIMAKLFPARYLHLGRRQEQV